MTDTVTTVPTAAQLREASEVLDRAREEGIGLDLIDNLAESIAKANDASLLRSDLHEVRYRLGDLCAHCNALLDHEGGGRYCSRECWGAEGGDL